MRFGVSSVNISPSGPVELAGYGYDLHRIGSTVETPLQANVLAMESPDGERAVLCSVDLLSVDEATVGKVREGLRSQLPDRDVTLLINASHTHSGPATRRLHGAGGYNEAYINGLLVPSLTSTIVRAFGTLADGEVGVARTDGVGLSYNRASGTSLDTRVTALRIASDHHTVDGAHLACHPVVYGKNSRVVSSDYPGVTREVLGRSGKADALLWLTGCAGDIDPLVNKERKGNTTRADVLELGNAVGYLALDLLKDIKLATGHFRAVATAVGVPIDTGFELDPKKEEKAYRELGQIPARQDLSPLVRWLETVAPVVNGNVAETIQVPVIVLRIGKVVFAGFGAEIYNATGLALESQHPDLQIVTMMNSNAHQGYIPTEDDYRLGNYAARSSAFIFGRKPLTPDSEAVFRDQASGILQQVVAS